MEELQPLLDQLKEADVAGDSTKASALVDQIKKVQAGAGSTPVAPAPITAAPPSSPEAANEAPPVDTVLQGALSSLKEADSNAATDPLEKLRAEEIATRISAGKPANLRKADLSVEPDLPEFKYTPTEVLRTNSNVIFGSDLGAGGSPVDTATVYEPSTLKEADLRKDPNWLASARILYKMNKGYEFEGSDDELHNYGLWTSSMINNNFADVAVQFANYSGGDPKAIKALLYNMEAGLQTDINWSNTGRSLAAQGMDPTNYIGGIVVKAALGQGVKVASVAALKSLLKRTLITGAVEGGVLATGFGGQDLAKQELQVEAGQKEAIDPLQSTLSALMGLGAGLGITSLGSLVGVALSKGGREAASDWMKGITVKVDTDSGEKLLQDVTPEDAASMSIETPVRVTMPDGTEKNAAEMTLDDWKAVAEDAGLELPTEAPKAPSDTPATTVAPTPTKPATEAPTWTTKGVLEDGSEVDVPSWEKILLENETEREAARKVETPYADQTPAERLISDEGAAARKEKMANGSATDVKTGISEITAIVKNEDFTHMGRTHADATKLVARIVDPIMEVFKRGQDDEIGDVLLDPLASFDLGNLKTTVLMVDSTIRARAEDAMKAVKLLKDKQANLAVITPEHLAELDAALAEWKQWTDLTTRTKPVADRLGSHAGLMLEQQKIIHEGIGPAVRKIDFADLRSKGLTEEKIMEIYTDAITYSRAEVADKSKQWRKLRKEYMQALAEGNQSKMTNAAKALAREEVRQAKLIANKASGWFDKVVRGATEWYTNSLLANFKTLEINMLTAWIEYNLRPALGVVGGAFSEHAWRRAGLLRSVLSQTRRESFEFAKLAWKEDFSNKTSRYADGEYHSIPTWLGGKLIRVPMRAMAFTDTYISNNSYKVEVAAQAADAFYTRHTAKTAELKAQLKKADPKAKVILEKRLTEHSKDYKTKIKNYVNKSVSEAIDEKGNKINSDALATSEDVLFKREFGGGGFLDKMFQQGEKFLGSHPGWRFAVPFYRTPIRVGEAYIKYIPGANMAHAQFRTDFFGYDVTGGGRTTTTYARDVARGKFLFGTAMMTAGWELASNNLMTGGGPVDPKQKKAWMDAGGRPYRIYTPFSDIHDQKTWMDISRLQPIAGPLMLIANISQRYKDYESDIKTGEQLPEEDVQFAMTMLSFSAISFAQSIKDMNMLQTMSNLFDTMNTIVSDVPSEEKWNEIGTFFSKVSQGMIPNFVRKSGDLFNDETVDPQTWTDMLQASLPGMKGPVNHSYTVLGRMRGGGSAIEGFIWLPIGISKGPDALTKADYVEKQIAIMEKVTESSFAIPTNHPDYPGLDLRKLRTVDNSMSLFDKLNRTMANAKNVNGDTMETALYNLLKNTDGSTLDTPGNATYNSELTNAVRKEILAWRDLAWALGMDDEVAQNNELLKKKAEVERLKTQAQQPYQHSIELLGMKQR